MPDRRFRDMSLTEENAEAMACTRFCYVDDYERFVARAKRLLPLWRAESIRRNRLWFALIGLGLDLEGDSLNDMTSREMLERIELSFRSERGAYARAKLRFILAELDR